jgi:hypothetical protein
MPPNLRVPRWHDAIATFIQDRLQSKLGKPNRWAP